MKARNLFLVSVLLFCAACHPGPPLNKTPAASTGGTIAGLVQATNSTAPLSGRRVTALNMATGARYDSTTAANGGYSIKVPEGNYHMELELHDGESLATRPDDPRVTAGDVDSSRNFQVTTR